MKTDLTGQQFGNYRLVRRLGVGGFASVYLGQHIHISSKQAAIKILDLRDVNVPQFRAEAETTEQLRHSNIVRLLDFDVREETPFLVLDYAPGGSLRARHPKGNQIPLTTVIAYLKELTPALQYAHDQRILHRDIKPDNILIGQQGELLLSDFGIALLSQTGKTSMRDALNVGGTPSYMAPEQFRGKPERASDQYALAVVVYEWLSGTVPFSEGDWLQIGYQHNHRPVPPLRASVPTLPTTVEQVVLKALEKQPQDRFVHVQDFANALQEASQPTIILSPIGNSKASLLPSSLAVSVPLPDSPSETPVISQVAPNRLTQIVRTPSTTFSLPAPMAPLPPKSPFPGRLNRLRLLPALILLILFGMGSIGVYGVVTRNWPGLPLVSISTTPLSTSTPRSASTSTPATQYPSNPILTPIPLFTPPVRGNLCRHYYQGVLQDNTTLSKNDCLLSNDARTLLLLQYDGDLVIYGLDINHSTDRYWDSGTVNKGGDHVTMRSDGNFVMYTASNILIWASGTQDHPHAWLTVQNDGNVVIYNWNGSYSNDAALRGFESPFGQ